MNWIDKCSQADECVTIGNCKIIRLLFADDLFLLSSTESGLQRALNSFADAFNTAGMKISTSKTEVHHLSRNQDQGALQMNGATLKQEYKFKYLRVAFTSDGRQDEELDTRAWKNGSGHGRKKKNKLLPYTFFRPTKLSNFLGLILASNHFSGSGLY